MEDSAGSADAEMEKVEETITFKLNKLKEVWTGFLQTAASKELIKTIIDGLTSISEAIIKVLETPGLNVAAITGLAAAILKLFKNATNPAREFLAVLKSLTGESSKLNKATTSASVFAKIASMMSGSSKLTGTASAAENAINVAVNTEDGVEALELLATASEGATVAVTATGVAATATSAEVAATSAVETANSGIVSILSAKYTALASSMGMSAGVFTAVWGTAIVAAVATAAHFYKVYKQESEYVENLNSDVEDLTETFATNSSEIQSTINSINSVSDKYQKLAKGVDQYGNNVSLSNDDFEEYNEISNQIADTFPELVSGYSDTDTAILECKDDIELLNKACENKAFESYAELLSGDNMSKLGKSIGISYNGYESDVFKIKTAGTEQQKEDLKSFEKELNNFQSIIKEAKTNGYTLNSILSTQDTISAGGVVDNDAYSYYLKLNKVLKQITAYGKEFNIDTSGIKLDYSVSEDTLDTVIDGIVSRFNVAESSIKDSEEEAEENFGLMVDGILHSSEKFSTLDDTSLENLKKFLTSTADIQGMINPDTNELEESTLRQWIDNLVEDGSWNKIENKINELFSFNSDSYDTLGEAQDALDRILAELAEYLDEDENELKIKLGFDTLDNSLDKMVAAALQGTDVEKTYKEQSSSDLEHEVENYARQITEAENKFQEAVAKRKEKYSSPNIVGNVDLNNRNVVAGVTMKAAGWEGDETTYSTIDTVTETLENIADESGETAFVVNVTPILPNGQVLTQESFQEYMNYLAQHATSADAILEADKTENGGYGLVLDSNDTVTGEDGKQQVITWNNVSAAIDEASVAAEGYHNEQAGIYDEEGSALLDETNLIQKKNEKIQESTNATEAYNQAQTKAAEELSNNKWSSDKEQAFLEFCTEAGDKYSDFTEKVKAFEQQYSDTMATAFTNESFATEIENFSKINEAYQKVAENIEKGKIGKDLASDIKDVEELRDLFQDISDYGDFDSFDEIETVLTSGASTAEQVQEAWDSLATSFWNAKLAAGGYSEETQKLISTQLQANGVTKEAADTYVKSLTTLATAKDVCTQAGKDITEMSDAEILAFALEANESAFTKDQLLLLEIAKYACNQAEINTVSDIEQLENLMTSAGATTLQLKALASAKAAVAAGDALTLKAENATNAADEQKYYQLAQKQYDRGKAEGQKTAADFINEYKSTMVGLGYQPTGTSSSGSGSGSGSSSDKDSDKDEDKWLKAYEKAYERLGELRDRDKIDEYEYLQYSRALYEKYFDSLNTSNTEWNNYVKLKKQYESLVEQKEKLAKQNAEASKTSASPEIKEEKENLEKLNAEYAELQKQLEEAKEARKAAYSDDWMGNVNLNDRPTVGGQTMAAAGWDEAGGVDSYSTVFTNTTTVKNPTNGSPWVVQFTPILPDGTVMDEQSCFDYIDSIISDATSAEEVMARDKADKGILFGVFDSYANDQGEVVSIDWDSNLDEAEEYYQEIAELRHEDQADIYDAEGAIVQEQQDVSNQIVAATQNIKDAVGDSAEDTQEAADKTGETVDSLEEKIQAASEKLSEAEKNLSDDTREYLEQLEEAEYNYLNGMKSLYESVFTWISSQLDDQTSELEDAKSKASDALEKQKTAATNALKAEKEAAVANIEAQIDALKDQQDAIQDQIDAYQDEIDAINDANDAREREITLQKALYELDKLNSQRTNLVYSESQGMHYEADLSGIRDAREDVDDAKDDIEIAKLEKKIDLLEDEKDALDDLIDDLEDQKDAIEDYYDKLIDESEAYYDNLIEESEAYYDNLIEQLEKQKDAVDELQDKWERAKMVASIRDLTGIDTSQLWDGLKNGSAEAIAQLSSLIDQLGSGYDNIVETMEKDNTHVLSTFESLNGIDLSSTTNYLDETADAFDKLAAVDFDVVKTGVDGIRDAFKSFSKDSDVVDVLGEHLGEAIAKGISDAKDSSEVKDAADSAGTETSKKVGESMTSEEAKSSIKEGAKEAVTEAGNSVKESAENGDAKEATDAAGTAIVKTVSDGMTSESATATLDEKSPEVITAAATSVTNAANGEQNADMLTAGEAIVCAIVNAMNSALDGEAGSIGISEFVTNFATKLQAEFSTLDLSKTLDFASLLGFGGEEDGEDGSNSLSAFIQQFVDAITKLNEQVKLVDISPIVTQFEDLKDAITGAAEALGGGEGGMSESTGEGGEGGNASGGKSKSSSSSNSGSEGSLISAMETLGTTAEDVLGGGEEGEGDGEEGGAGIIGKFATLKTKVQDVTAAIGLGDEEEGGGSSTEEEGGTLISAFEAEKKTFFDEEQGLPKQLEVWEEIMTAINGCVTAIEMLKKALIDLAEFSISVSVGGETSGFGGSKADGTFSFADGNLHVASHGYAGGNVGLAQDQQAYVGESGTELLVRSGQARLIGKNGAEMMSLKKGDIIFNASQTKELLKNGKIHSRGHAVGTHSYADGTPFNKALNFAGKDLSSSALTAIANQLTGAMLPMESNIEAINRNVADMAASVSNISSVNNTSNVTIGDIHVTGVQDVDGFAKAIKSYLPGKMTQALYS